MTATAGDVIAMLRRHYLPEGRPPGGVFAPEIGSPDGRRRADLIWCPTTIAGGNGLVGHEVKVSRADVVVELADPTKAEPWAQFCTRWWLVVSDPALVEGLDIPDAWGVLAPPSGRRTRSMTVLRPAPRLSPRDPSPGLRRLLAWQMHGTSERIGRLESEVQWRDREIERLRAEIGGLHLGGAVRTDPHMKRLQGILTAASARCSIEHLWGGTDDSVIVDAIVDMTATRLAARRVRQRLEQLDNDLRRVLDPLASARDDITRAARLGLADLPVDQAS